MPIRPLAPATSHRCFFCGSTGSGKTTLALQYLGAIRRTPIVIADTKGDDLVARFARTHGFYETDRLCVPSARYPRIVIRGIADPEWWDPLFWALLVQANVLLYIDELTHFQTAWNARAGKGLRSAYGTGRGRRLGVWASTQAPSGVPLQAMREADHIYAFRLTYPEDEDRMRRLIRFTNSRFDSNALPPYGFAYHTHGLKTPIVGRTATAIV